MKQLIEDIDEQADKYVATLMNSADRLRALLVAARYEVERLQEKNSQLEDKGVTEIKPLFPLIPQEEYHVWMTTEGGNRYKVVAKYLHCYEEDKHFVFETTKFSGVKLKTTFEFIAHAMDVDRKVNLI